MSGLQWAAGIHRKFGWPRSRVVASRLHLGSLGSLVVALDVFDVRPQVAHKDEPLGRGLDAGFQFDVPVRFEAK